MIFSDNIEMDKLIALTRFFFWLAVIQHFPRTGQLDKKPPAGIKSCCEERWGYKRPHQAFERYPKPWSLQRVCGLLSATQAERSGRSLSFNPSLNQSFWFVFLNTCISLYTDFVFQDSGVCDSLYNEKNLLFSVTNLFGAGTDTTAATLRWGLLLMAKYPQIQGDKNRSSR